MKNFKLRAIWLVFQFFVSGTQLYAESQNIENVCFLFLLLFSLISNYYTSIHTLVALHSFVNICFQINTFCQIEKAKKTFNKEKCIIEFLIFLLESNC